MMNTYKSTINLIGFFLVLLLSVACRPASDVAPATEVAPATTAVPESADESREEDGLVVEVANPAAVYCLGLGYTSEPRENAAGVDAACVFPDGSECGQWDFLAGRCGQQYSYCREQGGQFLEQGSNIGRCIFEDGSGCDEILFLKGECRPGDNPPLVDNGLADSADIDVAVQEFAVPVVGWLGYVISTGVGAQYDDYVVILPEGEVGSFGIEGATETVDKKIAALRDQEQQGKYAHFWGSLECEVMDFGGCQLLVDHLRVDGPGDFREADPVEGWSGKIISFQNAEPGAPQPDDAFVLAGSYPVQYGLDSAFSAGNGERELAGVIAGLRDSEQEVKIWGRLFCGVPDAGGCHIEVVRIEAGGELNEIPPVAMP